MAASTGSSPAGTERDGVGVEQHVLGQGAVGADHVVVEPGDEVADGVRRDVRADLDDAAGHVPAEPDLAAAGHDVAAGPREPTKTSTGLTAAAIVSMSTWPGPGTGRSRLDDLGLVVAGDGLEGTHRASRWVG